MPGMRHRESGRDCPCCSQWAPTRASEKRTWHRREANQVDPWSPWPRSTSRFAEDETLQFGYWSVVMDDDYYLNDQARPYLTRSES